MTKNWMKHSVTTGNMVENHTIFEVETIFPQNSKKKGGKPKTKNENIAKLDQKNPKN